MWDELNSRMKEILDPQKQKQWEQGQNLLRGLFNFDLKRDLAHPIGDEMAFAYEQGAEQQPFNVNYLFVIRLREPDQFKTTVSRAVALALARGVEKKQTTYQGRSIQSLSISYGSYAIQPSFTYDQSWFVLAASESLLKRAIDSKDSGNRITKNPEFMKLTSDFPRKVNGISYTDVSHVLKTYSEMVRQVGKTESGEWINEYQLPQELTELSEVLHDSASYTRNEKHGLVLKTHSSIPSGLLALPPLIKYWTGMPNR
jgi:hypothetical protein